MDWLRWRLKPCDNVGVNPGEALEAEKDYVNFLPKDFDPCVGCPMADAATCNLHQSFPSYLKINTALPLYGSVKPYFKHVLIADGTHHWRLSHVEEDKNSLAGMLHDLEKNSGKTVKLPGQGTIIESSPPTGTSTPVLLSGASTPVDVSRSNTPPLRRQTKAEADEEELREAQEAALKAAACVGKPKTRIIITNGSNSPSAKTTDPAATEIMVFPDMIAVHNVKINKDEAARFRRTFLTKRASKPPHLRGEEEIDTEEMDGFKISKLRYKAMVLICGHMKRDKRCGVTGPILQVEFNNYLKELGLEDDGESDDRVGVCLVSHIGGHKFAGNVIVYLRDGNNVGQGIWYGRITPHHVKAVVDETIVAGKVIREHYRGGLPEGKSVLDF